MTDLTHFMAWILLCDENNGFNNDGFIHIVHKRFKQNMVEKKPKTNKRKHANF